MPQIEHINKTIRSTLNPNQSKKPRISENNTLDEEAEELACDKCNFNTESADDLRKHIVRDNTVNVFLGVTFESEKTDERETDEIEENEHDTEIDDGSNESEEAHQEPFSCGQCEDTFRLKHEQERHLELHSYADNLSLAFHVCRVCDKMVGKKELNIQCSKCKSLPCVCIV